MQDARPHPNPFVRTTAVDDLSEHLLIFREGERLDVLRRATIVSGRFCPIGRD
jgi:hypothetical protein